MPTTPATSQTARTVDEQFLDLICADADLLAAAFDAIIAAEWPEPPVDRPGRSAAGSQAGRAPVRRAADPVGDADGGQRQPGSGGQARQRSPPDPTPDALKAERQVIATREPTDTR